MARTVHELDVVVTRLVEIYALERAVDSQNFFGLIVGLGRKISCLPFRQADHACGWCVDIKLG